MTDYTIPSWFVWLVSGFLTLFIPWAVWATIQIFRNDKVIALNQQTLTITAESVSKLEGKVEVRFDKLEAKIDQLIIQENSFFKQLVSR